MANTRSFYWHDYETFGTDPRRDWPTQFAGIRTDFEFNIIEDPVTLYCQTTSDCLPQPDACRITGITPQIATEKGVCEAEFIKKIHQQFIQPNTCAVGYNSIRFDDEVTRNSLYRNLHDPYEREWRHGNSRWDIIDMVRAARALRPEGINWVDDDEGRPSFRLEKLTKANDISHESAHDALSDVHATIAMAKLVKQAQPKLYDFLFAHRGKKAVNQLLKLGSFEPLVHISGMYPAIKGCLAIVLPICLHPTNTNGVIVYDLSQDPNALLTLSAEQINQRLFTPNADLPEGVERIALKTVHINKCPILAPLAVLKPNDLDRLTIDRDTCKKNAEKIKNAPSLIAKLDDVFTSTHFEAETNPDLMIYSGGFFSGKDKTLMGQIRNTPINQLAHLSPHFQDSRLAEMFFRYKARNYPQTLSADETQRWQTFCQDKLTDKRLGASLTLAEYRQRIDELKQLEGPDTHYITALEAYLEKRL
ncbi:MAG: exodeoxyribonuclease I [Methylococcales bacterium]|nr:exodeoxyribonuclease I [Methylococcales bacterium]MCK5925785.1 exodeoxyribonuclease I [Methylococcales bacterium]